jgi:hypothetical protein
MDPAHGKSIAKAISRMDLPIIRESRFPIWPSSVIILRAASPWLFFCKHFSIIDHIFHLIN